MLLTKYERFLAPLALLLVCAAVAGSAWALIQQKDAVSQACRIQQRGIAASHQLARFFTDYNQLLGIQKNTPAGRKQLAHLPPAQRQVTLDAIAAVAAYSQIVSHQAKPSC